MRSPSTTTRDPRGRRRGGRADRGRDAGDDRAVRRAGAGAPGLRDLPHGRALRGGRPEAPARPPRARRGRHRAVAVGRAPRARLGGRHRPGARGVRGAARQPADLRVPGRRGGRPGAGARQHRAGRPAAAGPGRPAPATVTTDGAPLRSDEIERAHLKDPRDASHTMSRYPVDDEFAGLLRRFWIPVWSVPPGLEAPQKVLQYPVSLVVVSAEYARFYSVVPGLSTTTLTGEGWA